MDPHSPAPAIPQNQTKVKPLRFFSDNIDPCSFQGKVNCGAASKSSSGRWLAWFWKAECYLIMWPWIQFSKKKIIRPNARLLKRWDFNGKEQENPEFCSKGIT